jgi:hypothetical protein
MDFYHRYFLASSANFGGANFLKKLPSKTLAANSIGSQIW